MSEPTLNLVYATTNDGVTNAGLLYKSATVPSNTCIVLVHGAGQNFYQPLLNLLAQEFARAGYPTITGNNRGHDLGVYMQNNEGLLLAGAAWERLEQSVLDVRGWIDFMDGQGYEQVVLLGHSRGSWKAVHYQAETHDERVAAVVACSGLLVHKGCEFRARHAVLAQEWAMFGHGEDFMPAAASPRKISAATYLDLFTQYASDDEPDITRVDVPVLSISGGNEKVTRQELEGIAALGVHAPSVTTAIIPDADHDYTHQEKLVARKIVSWLQETIPAK